MPIYGQETGAFSGSANLAGTESPNHVLNAINRPTDLDVQGHQQINFLYQPKRYWDDLDAGPWPAGDSNNWLASPVYDATYYRPTFNPPQSEQLYVPVAGTGDWIRNLTDATPTPDLYNFHFDTGLDIMVQRNYLTATRGHAELPAGQVLNSGSLVGPFSYNFQISALRFFINGGSATFHLVAIDNFEERDVTSNFVSDGFYPDDSFPGANAFWSGVDMWAFWGRAVTTDFFLRIRLYDIPHVDEDNFGAGLQYGAAIIV